MGIYGNLPQIAVKTKNLWNHHWVVFVCHSHSHPLTSWNSAFATLFLCWALTSTPNPLLRPKKAAVSKKQVREIEIVHNIGIPNADIYIYPNLLDPTNFSGPNANPGFPRDVGETPGFFRKITGLEEKPGFFPICWKFRPMITDDLEE